jgi:acyl dehydratase
MAEETGSGREEALAALQARVGSEIHLSDWLPITQERIDAFAAATGDQQWIHVDPERCARESPYGAPIAHGYLTLSLHIILRGLLGEASPYMPGVKSAINYGLNKLRFPSAVRVGSRIRGRFTLLDATVVAPGVVQITENFLVEVEGQAKPACIAESVIRIAF